MIFVKFSDLSPGKNIRLFKSSFLEKFSYVHPIMPIAIWGPFTVYCFSKGLLGQSVSLKLSVALLAAGLFTWTLAEYLLHRFVFHFKPKTPFQERLVFLFHGIHHDDPHDARRLLMPPVAAIAIATIFYLAFSAVLGWTLVRPFFGGFIIGYLCYDYIHFATHWSRSKGAWLKALRVNHMRHHFTAPDKRYGVSNTFWDRVFRTEEDMSKARSLESVLSQ